MSNSIKTMFINYNEEMIDSGIDKMILRDWDGVIFINPFTYRESNKNFIEIEGYDKTKSEADEKIKLLIDKCKIEALKEQDRELGLKILKNLEIHIDKIMSIKEGIDYNKLRKYLWLQRTNQMEPRSKLVKNQI